MSATSIGEGLLLEVNLTYCGEASFYRLALPIQT